jgi:hypothetical protein
MRRRRTPPRLHTLALAAMALGLAPSAWAQMCRPGSYSATGQEPCLPAPLGHYVATSGALAPTPAVPGFFVDGVGRTSATAAPRGFYVPGPAASSATPAVPGCYVPGTAFTACTPADRGHFVPTAVAVQQTAAAPGCYVPTLGQSTCTPAARGFYVPSAAAVEPTAAMPGRYAPDVGMTSPLLAQPGCYVPGTAATVCTPAAIGHYVSRAGAIAQTPAEIGRYVSIAGATQADLCPTGTSSYGGSEACRTTSSRALAGPPAVGPVWASSLGAPGRIDLGTVPGDTVLDVSWRNATRDLGYASRLTQLTLLAGALGGRDGASFEIVGLVPGAVADFGDAAQGFAVQLRRANGTAAAGLFADGPFDFTLSLLTDVLADPGERGEVLSWRITGNVAAIPEPGTWALWLAGLAAVAWVGRRRRRLAAQGTAAA